MNAYRIEHVVIFIAAQKGHRGVSEALLVKGVDVKLRMHAQVAMLRPNANLKTTTSPGQTGQISLSAAATGIRTPGARFNATREEGCHQDLSDQHLLSVPKASLP